MRNLVVFCLLLSAVPAQATTYRWVDAEGKVHYGDILPNKAVGMGHKELDKQGRVVRETQRTLLSPEERRQRLDETAAREAQLRRVEDQQRRDRALLSTYSNEDEIDLARDRALELENLAVKGLQSRLDNSAAKLTSANSQIARYRAARVAAPANIVQMRDEAQAEMLQHSEALRQREKIVDELKRRFEADKTRYQELQELKAVTRP